MKIASARRALGLTRAEFARMIGCDPATLWRWEKGATSKSLAFKFAQKIARRKAAALKREARSVQQKIRADQPLSALIRATKLYNPTAPL